MCDVQQGTPFWSVPFCIKLEREDDNISVSGYFIMNPDDSILNCKKPYIFRIYLIEFWYNAMNWSNAYINRGKTVLIYKSLF